MSSTLSWSDPSWSDSAILSNRISSMMQMRRERVNSDGVRLCGTIRPMAVCGVCLDLLNTADVADEVDNKYGSPLSQPITMLECRHAYHNECLRAWMARSNLCPVCRKATAAQFTQPDKPNVQLLRKTIAHWSMRYGVLTVQSQQLYQDLAHTSRCLKVQRMECARQVRSMRLLSLAMLWWVIVFTMFRDMVICRILVWPNPSPS